MPSIRPRVSVVPRRGAGAGAALSAAEVLTFLVAAHTWAGGRLPGPGWVVLTGALLFAAGLLVQRHRLPLRAVVPALVAAQLLLHGWLTALGGDAHAHGSGPGYEPAAPLGLEPRMLLAHVAGAVVTALVWELRRRAVLVVLAWSSVGRVPAPTPRRVLTTRRPVPRPRQHVVVVPLRGPPSGVVPA